MGVHISRIQSMELDKLGTSELLVSACGKGDKEAAAMERARDTFSLPTQLAKNVGNSSFNEILEGNLPCPSPKPTPSSDM